MDLVPLVLMGASDYKTIFYIPQNSPCLAAAALLLFSSLLCSAPGDCDGQGDFS